MNTKGCTYDHPAVNETKKETCHNNVRLVRRDKEESYPTLVYLGGVVFRLFPKISALGGGFNADNS